MLMSMLIKCQSKLIKGQVSQIRDIASNLVNDEEQPTYLSNYESYCAIEIIDKLDPNQ